MTIFFAAIHQKCLVRKTGTLNHLIYIPIESMVTAYCIIFVITLSIVLNAFIKDTDADGNIEAWLFILLTALLWPITLPFIISSKLRAYQKRIKANRAQSPKTQPSQEALP